MSLVFHFLASYIEERDCYTQNLKAFAVFFRTTNQPIIMFLNELYVSLVSFNCILLLIFPGCSTQGLVVSDIMLLNDVLSLARSSRSRILKFTFILPLAMNCLRDYSTFFPL